MARSRDASYFLARANHERDVAAREERPEIRRIHLELASRYAAMLQGAEGESERPTLTIVVAL